MKKTIWLKDGVSTFPVQQPMVGQKEFYDAFKSYLQDLKDAPMARVFPLIAKWGIGKSRIAYELISEALGVDKGWTIRNVAGELTQVRLLEKDFADGILPIYIRYEQMNEDFLYGDNWVGYGAYIALTKLADESPPKSIQGNIIKHTHDHLVPMGFLPDKLAEQIELGKHSTEEILENLKKLDLLVEQGLDYLRQFGIVHLMVIVDEVESEYELIQDGLQENNEERKKKLDGEAIKVITSAIKHEDSRSRHPHVSFLLLCSPAIGDQIKALEALDRRGEKLEIHQNSYADIRDYIESLQQQAKLRQYPIGLVEAAYTIAAGNFGWLNVIMAYCDQYLDDHTDADAGEVLEDRSNAITRFKERLIDGSQFDYISADTSKVYLPMIKRALLKQLPQSKDNYNAEQQKILLSAKNIEGIGLFKEFATMPLTKSELGLHLVNNKYKTESDNVFINEVTAESFNLDVLLRSLATYSINAPEDYYLLGESKETFLAQVRMLYPKDEVADAAEVIYEFIEPKLIQGAYQTFIGPNFAFLERLNRRYANKGGISNYLVSEEKDQKLQEYLKLRRRVNGQDTQNIVLGFTRILEQSYQDIDTVSLKIHGVDSGWRTIVSNHPYLGVHPQQKVDVIWAGRLAGLNDLADSKLLEIGSHPIFILSSTAEIEAEVKQFKKKFPYAGRCLIPFQVTNLQRELLEILSVDQSYMDIRAVAHELAPAFKSKVRALRDEVTKVTKEWFDQVDQQGYVLRPLIFTKAEEEKLPLLAEGFSKMVINGITSTQLGIKPGVKFKANEDYNRFLQVLKSTEIRVKLEKEGYRNAGMFVAVNDSEYEVQIPNALGAILEYIGNTQRTYKNLDQQFFFSAIDTVKPAKIVEQWVNFLQALHLVKVNSQSNIINVSKSMLEAKKDRVQIWRDEEYDKLVDQFKNTIDKHRLGILRDDKYRGRMDVIDENLRQINLIQLQHRTNNSLTMWKDQLEKLNDFHQECDYIFDEEGWESLPFNENNLGNLNIADSEMPIWRKLRLVQQFHEYISSLQKEILDKLKVKVQSIKTDSEYKGYRLPIAPFTNALERYQTEIEYAADYIQSSKRDTMVAKSESLANQLWLANYKEAIERLNTMILQIGLRKLEPIKVDWKEKSGFSGRYDELLIKFKKLVDSFNESKVKAERWITYFQASPDEVKLKVKLKEFIAFFKQLQIFLESGFDEAVDDLEGEYRSNPIKFIDETEKKFSEHQGDTTNIIANITELEASARRLRNAHYDTLTIEAVNRLFKRHKKEEFEADTASPINEETYTDTLAKVTREMRQLTEFGENYFAEKGVKHVRFGFFKDVVQSSCDLDWSQFNQQKQELVDLGLIQTRVVLI
ncbi:hypothetical protein GCM10008018_45240 [Paenibacillus marchantiophytorum]|uniref:BREX system P-loop protein BrxC n=1 Tax=Paenibacillus marchantiophytorum TaxID=1619310 RepID=A0ABQ1EZR9_9BACL|nr:hypothetical protein [Paenibacillus marchantiophytorum]GFZ93772.1 hypothetical protein GCM10008018_45240 [Paenibacillus marchantiophytorum]